ncbi:luciferase-like monooxygenase [Kribbella amoyensis]|uniref:Luciferase-like monooxygenase n=1 Tax=Kribbella amoyensis TaxID=996641 RepID=A0A561BSR0_9ACTN|nr:LLM class flavin-dependent oxidoreductase [Kribbella amoyensis]TWD81905.1 luciferase-like monooxygenase [Kribbella amoyensis]
MSLRSALWLPLFDELSDPATVVQLAVEAEDAGWDGFFVWDHVNWNPPIRAVADPWVVLSAVAARTERLRLGPMVTPLPRRRPVKLARETATLDQLSGGRLVLGVGLGSDRFGREFSATGDEVNDRVRAQQLDESLAVLAGAWSGEEVRFEGEHYRVDGLTFEPTPVQRPRVPVWVAGFPGKRKPMERAVRWDGFFPVNLDHADQVAEILAELKTFGAEEPFDVVVGLEPEVDPRPYEEAGATWRLVDFDPEHVTVAEVRAVLRAGPGA